MIGKEQLPLDPNTELFRWGPAPIRAFYTADFLEGIFNSSYFQSVFHGESWPRGLALYKGGSMIFVNELREIEVNGRSVFLHYMLPVDERKKVFAKWCNDLARLNECERELDSKNFEALSDKEFLQIWNKFHSLTINLWTNATMPELANYGSIPLLEAALSPYVNEANKHHVLEVLTAPGQPSFYQIEEMELYETNNLFAHQQRYFWLKNSYSSVEIASIGFFEERKNKIHDSPRGEFEKKQHDVREEKRKIIEQYHLPASVIEISLAIVEAIEWQDDRKKHIWIYLHYKNMLLSEVCRRTKKEKDLLLNFKEIEIEQFFLGSFDMDSRLFREKEPFGFLCGGGKVEELGREVAKSYWDIYSREKMKEKTSSLFGILVSKGGGGKISGRVQIILDPKNSTQFTEGSILVAPMTTPEYVFLMKKSVAVITDTGGLTSHAAITSRELRKLCIVGTKIATQVLHDGDLVEVDADNGVVRILKKY
jgi:phosphoenolpyruvate synthase/pyruvate phosphate dikinase